MERKILIVDDEADIREILQFNLENAGYVVECAGSAEEALEMLRPYHSLILLDVMMGGMSGFKMADVLRKEKSNNIPIIFLTAKSSQNDLLTGFSAGGDDYISFFLTEHTLVFRLDDGGADSGLLNVEEAQLLERFAHTVDADIVVIGDKGRCQTDHNGVAALQQYLDLLGLVHDLLGILRANHKALTAQHTLVADDVGLIA